MIPSNVLPLRSAMIAVGCAFLLALMQVPAANAAGAATPQPVAEKARGLPLTATFEKVTVDGVMGYVLNLKNVSSESVKVTVTVVPSVTFHGNAKTRTLPAHAIDAGQVWTVPDLAAQDKVSVAADGFETLDLTVP